jgi:hypothetical protein
MKFRPYEIFLGCFLTVAIFAMGMLFESSYQPSPAAKNQSQQAEPATQNHDTGIPPVTNHAKDGQTTQHKEEKSEFWSAKLTDWLLAAFTALLVAFTYRLWKSTDKLWIAGERQIGVAERSATVAERALTDIERPYLFIFNISALRRIEEAYDFDEEQTYNLLRVTYSVANYGKIPAIIEQAAIGLSIFTEPLDPVLADFNHALSVSPILTAGELRPDIGELTSWTGEVGGDEYSLQYPELGNDSLWFRAEIKYRGPFTKGHETSVCLRYDPRTGRFFESLGVEKHNYQT